jgi:hypothetical protein
MLGTQFTLSRVASSFALAVGCFLATACAAPSEEGAAETQGAMSSEVTTESTWLTGEQCGRGKIRGPRGDDQTYNPHDYLYPPDCSGEGLLPPHVPGAICGAQTSSGPFWCWAVYPGPPGTVCQCPTDLGWVYGGRLR